MWMWLLLLSWCAMSMPTVGQAAMGAGSNGASDEALGTTVISQRMTFKNQQSQAVFDGAVVLTRGTLVVYSDRHCTLSPLVCVKVNLEMMASG